MRRVFAQFVENMATAPGSGVWIVRSLHHKRRIGIVELSLHKDGQDHEISYQFLPMFWGKGLATEAIAAVIYHGINEVGLNRIIAETQRANQRSCQLLLRQGFQEIERLDRFGAEQIIFATTGNNDGD